MSSSAAMIVLFSVLPVVLAVAALVDVVRTGASRFWIPVVIIFPVMGSLAYFAVERLVGSGATTALGGARARRSELHRRAAALELQLAHWRGPAPLTEMGEVQLALGRQAAAEPVLREALATATESTRERALLALGETLAALGRPAEAVPFLEELHAAAPDYRQGDAALLLGRCLDEAGPAERAAAVLRQVLERRGPAEAQVRLARLALLAGRREEAAPLLERVVSEAATAPPFQRRLERPWVAAARRLRRGRRVAAPLPRPAARRAGAPLAALALGLAVVLVALGVGGYWWMTRVVPGMTGAYSMERWEAMEASRKALFELGRRHPSPLPGDLATVALAPAELDRYVRVRRALAPQLAAFAAASRPPAPEATEAAAGFFAALREASELTDLGGRRLAVEDELLAAAVATLSREAMGPDELAGLATLVEWRFLGRAEALPLGLAPVERQQLTLLHSQLRRWSAQTDGDWRQERALAEARSGLAALEAKARGDVALSAATTTLLAARRAELEAIPAAGVAELGHLLDPGAQME